MYTEFNENIMQYRTYFSPNWIISIHEVYKELMYCSLYTTGG
jgi:hypothetical protein